MINIDCLMKKIEEYTKEKYVKEYMIFGVIVIGLKLFAKYATENDS